MNNIDNMNEFDENGMNAPEEVKVAEAIGLDKQDNNNILNMDDLEKELKKERKIMKDLKKKKANVDVIEAQKQVVLQLENQIEKSKQTQTYLLLGDEPISVEIVDEKGQKEIVEKKIAFAENNRIVNYKKVQEFMSIIRKQEYEHLYPIIVAEAKEMLAKQTVLKTASGELLNSDNGDEYVVVLDGQHRCSAFLKLNQTEKKQTVPNVHIKKGIGNIGKYLVSINEVGNWRMADRSEVAALVHPNENLFTIIAQKMKEGFKPSTLGLIYTGVNLRKDFWEKSMAGDYKLPNSAKLDIERGERFIEFCTHIAGINVKLLSKRYFIEGFNSFATATSEDTAFAALKRLKEKNYTSNDYGKVHSGKDFITLLKGEKLE